MCNKGLTYEGALVELNRLNSAERLPVNERNLKAAIAVARAAILKQIKREPVGNIEGGLECPVCGTTIDDCPPYIEHFCDNCGQALDWSKE